MNRCQARITAGTALVLLLAAGCGSPAPPLVTSPVPAATVTGRQPATPPPAASLPASPHPAATRSASSQPAVPPSAAGHVPVNRNKWPAGWTLPDRKLSPGAVQPGYGIRDICPHVNPALEAMRPSTAEKALVYRAYGIFSHPAGKYEIDHVDAIELLGLAGAPAGNPTLNLYPELNDTPDPAMLLKYGLSRAFVHNSKDVLEDVLHADVCAGRVPLATAQHAIMTDWRVAYVTYVGPPPHLALAPVPTRAAIAPPATHSAAPAQASCYPKTSGGNCYRAGEFCRKSDLGSAGVAGNGERIRCEASGSRNRWEPA